MPLVTTLETSDRDSVLEDFESRASCISLYDTGQGEADKLLEVWNEYIPYTPMELSKIFSESVSQGLTLSVEFLTEEEVIFALHYPHNFPPSEHYEKQEIYDLRLKSIEHNDIHIDIKEQGSGLGRRISAEFIDLNVALGIKKSNFTAEKSVGGYVWAKMGYYLDK